MKFTISCATFSRLAGIPAFFEPTTKEDVKNQLKCVRLESRNGHVFAVATNQKIAAVEYIGATKEGNGSVHVVIDPVLIKQCASEAIYDSMLEIVYVPEILLATAKTMMGYTFQGNCAAQGVPESSVLSMWRTWIPKAPPQQSSGGMYWNVDHIAALAGASPSGKIVFPAFIDVEQPVIIRDVENPNWFGFFMGAPAPTEPDVTPAVLPEWMKI